MAIIKKYNPKHIYLSDRMKKKFETIFDSSITIVEAPAGYGKTTCLSEFMTFSGKRYVWFNIDNGDKNQFFSDFCAKVDKINTDVANKLREIGYPTDEHSSNKIANLLMQVQFNKKIIFVLDNYNYIADEFANNIIKDLSGKKDGKLSIVLVTRTMSYKSSFDIFMSNKINFITKEDLVLEKKEIDEYYKICGIKLENDEIDSLYNSTDGWINALYIQLHNYVENATFEYSLGLNNLVYKTIWKNLSVKEQDFLIGLGMFECFSFRQAIAMSENISEDEINELLENNSFIEYRPVERRYYVNNIFKIFLQNEFEKLDPKYQKNLYKLAGKWCAENDEHYLALSFYTMINDYESILSLNWNNSKISYKVIKDNKKLFLDVVFNTTADIKKKYCKNYLFFVFCLFVLNERHYFNNELSLIDEYVDSHENEDFQGEVAYLRSLYYFNDLKEMNNCYEVAYKYLKSTTKMFKDYNFITFGNPSVLSMIHIKEGELLNEIGTLENVMPNYYVLTEGNNKGLDSIMKAEALFEQGNLEDAIILCEKAKYMAESRGQTELLIIVELLKARISLMKAEFDNVSTHLNNMTDIYDDNKYNNHMLIDMCKGMVNIMYDNIDDVPDWLKDSQLIENKVPIVWLGYANVIYGRYLLATGDYNKLLAISGQMLNIAELFSNIMYKIYTYIYIAVANYYMDKKDKAINMLEQAVKLAYKDNIVMPFVAVATEIENLFVKISIDDDNKYEDFMENLKLCFKEYGKGISVVKKAAINTQSYGLTKREYEVAKLAAQRLSNKEIAEVLFIAEGTVKSNLKIIFSKLSINSRGELKDFFK